MERYLSTASGTSRVHPGAFTGAILCVMSERDASNGRERYLVTSALPYANGPLHVGQIVGAYLPADVFVRYLRARGHDVVYVCGTDEHGVPITLTAEREGKSPREIVDYWWAHMKETFERLRHILR